MLLPCTLVIKTTRWAAASAADTHSLLTPSPCQSRQFSPFSLGLFQSIESFHELGGGGRKGNGGEKEKGSKKERERMTYDLLSICAVVTLKMLSWVRVYT